jgi:hypothetical protein
MLVLPGGSFIEYQLPENLLDRPGVDLAVMFFAWGRKPEILVVDRTGEPLRPTLSACQTNGYGFFVYGFDLSGVSLPLKSLRIMGLDDAGPHGGCGLGPINAYTGEAKTSQAAQSAESAEAPPARQPELPSIPR